MAQFDRGDGNVIWLRIHHSRNIDTHFIAGDVAVFLIFLLATCLAAEMLSRAFASWTGLARSVALSFVSASGFL